MLSRLQELRREEETLLRVKAALHDQLRRLRRRHSEPEVAELKPNWVLRILGTVMKELRPSGQKETKLFQDRQVEELALQSMIRSSEENVAVPSSALAGDAQQTLGQMDNEAAINQTELHLSLQGHQEEEEEEEEESDS